MGSIDLERREGELQLVATAPFKMASHRECRLPAWDDSPHHAVDVHMPSPRYWLPHAVQWQGGQTLPRSPNAGSTKLQDVPAGVMERPLGVPEWTSLHIQRH